MKKLGMLFLGFIALVLVACSQVTQPSSATIVASKQSVSFGGVVDLAFEVKLPDGTKPIFTPQWSWDGEASILPGPQAGKLESTGGNAAKFTPPLVKSTTTYVVSATYTSGTLNLKAQTTIVVSAPTNTCIQSGEFSVGQKQVIKLDITNPNCGTVIHGLEIKIMDDKGVVVFHLTRGGIVPLQGPFSGTVEIAYGGLKSNLEVPSASCARVAEIIKLAADQKWQFDDGLKYWGSHPKCP